MTAIALATPLARFWHELGSDGVTWHFAEYPSVPGTLVYGKSEPEVRMLLDQALAAVMEVSPRSSTASPFTLQIMTPLSQPDGLTTV